MKNVIKDLGFSRACLFTLLCFLAPLSVLRAEPQNAMNPTSQAAFQQHKEWFGAFLKNTDQKGVLKRTVLHYLQTDFPQIWSRIQDPDYAFTSLFVGVGSGGLEIPLLQEFALARGMQNNFVTFCEDPSPQMKEAFFIAAKKEGVEDQIVEYNLALFEDPSYMPPQADLALASHVWYYVNEWRGVEAQGNSLVKFAKTLSERSGTGMIALHSGTSDRFLLSSTYASLLGLKPELAGEEIAAELFRQGIQHKCVITESHLNIASCFNQGRFDPNEEGINLLSFIFRAPWNKLDPSIQERLLPILLSQVQANGKEVLILRDCQIWISK